MNVRTMTNDNPGERAAGGSCLPRVAAVAAAVVALVLGVAAPADATDYGRPSGRWFEAIVSHEVGHALGAFTHTAYPYVMRPSLSPSKINAGYHPYTPQPTDLARMQASRVDSVWGENDTAYVPYPFHSDYVPVFNRTGRAAAFTAANRWEPGPLNIVQVYSEPSNGITLMWDWSLAGRSIGGYVEVTRWVWNGKHWQVADANVRLNPDVET